ncbi:MAG: phytase [Marinifilaceae bacterium]|jgi:3-phytase|nr:phytase [Marinifilaceae bacterium]
MKIYKTISLILLIFIQFFTISCDESSNSSRIASKKIQKTVEADIETQNMGNRSHFDDSAHDIAVWINKAKPEMSRIIGTDKMGGLAVYSLRGNELDYHLHGNINAVDIRQDIKLANESIDILGVSNITTNTIDIYQISQSGHLIRYPQNINVKMNEEICGFCMGYYNGKLYAFASSKYGTVEQWQLRPGFETLNYHFVKSFSFSSKAEGMVYDDITGNLYVAEEKKAIWKLSLNDNGSRQAVLLKESEIESNSNIYSDIEGLSIFYSKKGLSYLVASIQGNYSYAIFDTSDDFRYKGSFRISSGKFDSVERSKGIEICSKYLGENFPNGIFIAQDGENFQADKPAAQNFKIVSMDKIIDIFDFL